MITYLMLQREAVRIASSLGLEPDYHNTDAFKFMYYNNAMLHRLEYKNRTTLFHPNDLEMSIDDFAEEILYPFLLSMLTNDLKFIHFDCT